MSKILASVRRLFVVEGTEEHLLVTQVTYSYGTETCLFVGPLTCLVEHVVILASIDVSDGELVGETSIGQIYLPGKGIYRQPTWNGRPLKELNIADFKITSPAIGCVIQPK